MADLVKRCMALDTTEELTALDCGHVFCKEKTLFRQNTENNFKCWICMLLHPEKVKADIGTRNHHFETVHISVATMSKGLNDLAETLIERRMTTRGMGMALNQPVQIYWQRYYQKSQHLCNNPLNTGNQVLSFHSYSKLYPLYWTECSKPEAVGMKFYLTERYSYIKQVIIISLQIISGLEKVTNIVIPVDKVCDAAILKGGFHGLEQTVMVFAKKYKYLLHIHHVH
jgi:hypothetical protein